MNTKNTKALLLSGNMSVEIIIALIAVVLFGFLYYILDKEK